ncbi:MAG: ABC transporter substrate-binding protein [Actinomycetota bacterium]
MSEDKIRIGGIFALSGPVSHYGKYSSTSVKAFFNMINEQGGINGRKVEYIAYDDAVDSNRALAAAKRAIEQDKVFALVGDQQIFTYSATGPYITSKNVPVITSGIGAWATNPKATNSVTVGLSTGCQGILQAKAMIARKIKKPGFLYFSGLEEPLNSRDKTYEYLKARGVDIAYEEAVSLAQPDFTATVARMRARGVDGFANLIDTSAIFRLFQSMQRANYVIPSVGPISDYDTTYETLGKQYGELTKQHSIVAQMENINATENPEVRLHRETLKKYYPDVYGAGGGYGMWTLYAWDAGRLFVDALGPLGRDITRSKLLAAMQGLKNWSHGLHPPFPQIGAGAENNFTAKVLAPGDDFKFRPLAGRDFWWNCNPDEDPPTL